MSQAIRQPAIGAGRGTLGVVFIVAVWLAATSGLRGLMQPDEGRYIGVAWEMVRSGDWLVPTLNGLPFFHKPPLFYWITSTSLSVFGLHDWAGRVGSLVGAFAAAVALFSFARRWSGLGTARSAALVLVTQPGFFIGAQYANLDMLVAGCIGVTVCLLAHAVLLLSVDSEHEGVAATSAVLAGLDSKRRLMLARRATLLAWFAAACGVLAKGLIGFVLPGLIIFIWLLLTRRTRHLKTLMWWPGLLFFAVVVAPWFVLMQMRYPGFFDYFFLEQHVRRFAGAGFNNAHPFWFYVPVLALMTLPWSGWLVAQLPFSSRRFLSRNRADARSAAAAGSDARSATALGTAARRAVDPINDSIRSLMWVWLATIVVFFSLPSSKLVGYVFPALMPLAWLVGERFARHQENLARHAKAWRASAVIGAVLCLVAVLALARFQPPSAAVLGQSLLSQRRAGEPVVMINRYVYDLAYQARLAEPSMVVDDWLDPQLPMHDNWRKELFDAGRFASPDKARLLAAAGGLRELLCANPVVWMTASRATIAVDAMFAGLSPVAVSGDAGLWRLESNLQPLAGQLHCQESPHGQASGN